MSKYADNKKLPKKKERKGHWPGILLWGGGSKQKDRTQKEDGVTKELDLALVSSLM